MDESTIEGVDDASDRVFETQHPYNKVEQKYTRQIKTTGAIGYVVEFDRRCSVESAHDVLLLKSGDFNQQISDRVGTEFRFDHAPSLDSKYVMLGRTLDVEFKWTNPRGRGNVRGGRGGRGGAAAQ